MAETLDATNKFTTHFNYIKCMNGMLYGVSVTPLISDAAVVNASKLNKFIRLARLTKRSINNELFLSKQQVEYSAIVAPWLPVKCYYRIYYLESALLHLTSGTEAVFMDGGHKFARNQFRELCRQGRIGSTNKQIERVVSVGDAIDHRIKSGSNITSEYYLTTDCIDSVRAKIARDMELHWKLNKGWKRYSTTTRKEARDNYRQGKYLCLLDYFYQMRLKANYRDVDFLDSQSATPEQCLAFIEFYVSATERYCSSLSASIKTVAESRRSLPLTR